MLRKTFLGRPARENAESISKWRSTRVGDTLLDRRGHEPCDFAETESSCERLLGPRRENYTIALGHNNDYDVPNSGLRNDDV